MKKLLLTFLSMALVGVCRAAPDNESVMTGPQVQTKSGAMTFSSSAGVTLTGTGSPLHFRSASGSGDLGVTGSGSSANVIVNGITLLKSGSVLPLTPATSSTLGGFKTGGAVTLDGSSHIILGDISDASFTSSGTNMAGSVVDAVNGNMGGLDFSLYTGDIGRVATPIGGIYAGSIKLTNRSGVALNYQALSISNSGDDTIAPNQELVCTISSGSYTHNLTLASSGVLNDRIHITANYGGTGTAGLTVTSNVSSGTSILNVSAVGSAAGAIGDYSFTNTGSSWVATGANLTFSTSGGGGGGDPSVGLYAFLKLTADANDSSGNARNFSNGASGTVTFSSSGANFDGGSSLVNSGTFLNTAGDESISFWINGAIDEGGTENARVYHKDDFHGITISVNMQTGICRASGDDVLYPAVETTSSVLDGTWHFVKVRYIFAEGTIEIGVDAGTMELLDSQTMVISASGLTMGGTDFYFTGLLRDVAFYSSAVSDAVFTTLYGGGTPWEP